MRSCTVGNLVKIDPSRYAKYAQRKVPNIAEEIEGYQRELVGYSFKTVEIDGEKHLILQDNDVEYVVEEFEDIDPPLILSKTNSSLIV